MNGLPNIIDYNLKVLFIGYNPGITSALTGHHYAFRGNGFWKLLHESGLTPYRFSPEEDRQLLELGFGSTNIVDRPTKGAADIKAFEFREGAMRLRELMQKYKPQTACYVGIGVYKAFSGKKQVSHGLQEDCTVDNILDYVCPSPSGLNRMPYKDQLQHFIGLKTLILKQESNTLY